MKNFIRKFKEKFKEYYAFRYLCYSLLYFIVGILFLILSGFYPYFEFLTLLLIVIWFILVYRQLDRLSEIRSKISKELNLEKLVNEEYIKEFIKEKK